MNAVDTPFKDYFLNFTLPLNDVATDSDFFPLSNVNAFASFF